jgi:hypothetical protein
MPQTEAPRTRLERLWGRKQELKARETQLVGELEELRPRRAQAIADGTPPGGIRSEIRERATELEEIREALPLVDREIEDAERGQREADAIHAAREADRQMGVARIEGQRADEAIRALVETLADNGYRDARKGASVAGGRARHLAGERSWAHPPEIATLDREFPGLLRILRELDTYANGGKRPETAIQAERERRQRRQQEDQEIARRSPTWARLTGREL